MMADNFIVFRFNLKIENPAINLKKFKIKSIIKSLQI